MPRIVETPFVCHTEGMEPESHRLDREAMLADHAMIARRVALETDRAVAAAAEKRRAFFIWFINKLHREGEAQIELQRLLTNLPTSLTIRATADPTPAASEPHSAGPENPDIGAVSPPWAATG